MDEHQKLALTIIDEVEAVVLSQHPELNLHTEAAEGIDEPAVVCGSEYYALEDKVASMLKKGL